MPLGGFGTPLNTSIRLDLDTTVAFTQNVVSRPTVRDVLTSLDATPGQETAARVLRAAIGERHRSFAREQHTDAITQEWPNNIRHGRPMCTLIDLQIHVRSEQDMVHHVKSTTQHTRSAGTPHANVVLVNRVASAQ